MGYREDEKRWRRIQEMLAAEASGKVVRPVVSQRTLFGIPSSVEVAIERIVAEDEQARRERRKQQSGHDAENAAEDGNAPGDGNAAGGETVIEREPDATAQAGSNTTPPPPSSKTD